jgi:hypothetical protein
MAKLVTRRCWISKRHKQMLRIQLDSPIKPDLFALCSSFQASGYQLVNGLHKRIAATETNLISFWILGSGLVSGFVHSSKKSNRHQ